MGKTTVALYAAVLLLLLQSCSIERRQHLPGYYHSWNKNTGKTSGLDAKNGLAIEVSMGADAAVQDASASIKGEIVLDQPLQTLVKDVFGGEKPKGPQECDIILLVDGEEINAKVVEITHSEIRFKRCDNIKGPTISIKKSEVFMISYPNGTKDVFYEEPRSPVKTVKLPSQEKNNLATLSFIFSLLTILFYPFALVGIITGIIALAQISKSPGRYSNKWMAITGLALGLGFLIAFASLIYFLLYLP